MKKLILILSIVFVQACAFTEAKLNITHDIDGKFNGPIREVSPIDFSAPNITDGREVTERIGWKRNGYGQNTANILSVTPVETLVSNAITTGLKKNNHKISETGDVAISGSVDKFWFDFDPNFWTIEFMGSIQCTLVFSDKKSGEEIYKSSYNGTFSHTTGGGATATWEMVMGKTLDMLIDDLVFDEELTEALQNR